MSTTAPLEVGRDDTDTHYLVTGVDGAGELESIDLVENTATWVVPSSSVEQVVVLDDDDNSSAMTFVYLGLVNLVALLALAAYLALG